MDREGSNIERCLKWGGRIVKESLLKQPKKGVGKDRTCS